MGQAGITRRRRSPRVRRPQGVGTWLRPTLTTAVSLEPSWGDDVGATEGGSQVRIGQSEARCESESIEFKPRIWRYLLQPAVYCVLLTGMVWVGRLGAHRFSWVFPVSMFAIGMVAACLLSVWAFPGFKIVVNRTEVVGPVRWWFAYRGPRQAIPLAALDRTISRERSRIARLLGYQYLHSVNGEYILLDRRIFSRPDRIKLLRLLGLEDE